MELLKKTVVIIFIIVTTNSYGQETSLINAFSKSYELETNLKYTEAIQAINAVYDVNSYEINLRSGWLNYMAGKYQESISYYQKSINLMPAATEPLWAIINPLAALEKWNEVESKYFIILKLDPKNSVANYRLGLIYYYRKDYVNAKKYFDIALNLFPFNYEHLIMSAWTNYFLGKKTEANTLFKKSLLYKPNDSSALEGLGLTK